MSSDSWTSFQECLSIFLSASERQSWVIHCKFCISSAAKYFQHFYHQSTSFGQSTKKIFNYKYVLLPSYFQCQHRKLVKITFLVSLFSKKIFGTFLLNLSYIIHSRFSAIFTLWTSREWPEPAPRVWLKTLIGRSYFWCLKETTLAFFRQRIPENISYAGVRLRYLDFIRGVIKKKFGSNVQDVFEKR